MLGWPLKRAKNNFAGNKCHILKATPEERVKLFSGGIMRELRLALMTDSRGRGMKGLTQADNDVRKLLKSK